MPRIRRCSPEIPNMFKPRNNCRKPTRQTFSAAPNFQPRFVCLRLAALTHSTWLRLLRYSGIQSPSGTVKSYFESVALASVVFLDQAPFSSWIQVPFGENSWNEVPMLF